MGAARDEGGASASRHQLVIAGLAVLTLMFFFLLSSPSPSKEGYGPPPGDWPAESAADIGYRGAAEDRNLRFGTGQVAAPGQVGLVPDIERTSAVSQPVTPYGYPGVPAVGQGLWGAAAADPGALAAAGFRPAAGPPGSDSRKAAWSAAGAAMNTTPYGGAEAARVAPEGTVAGIDAAGFGNRGLDIGYLKKYSVVDTTGIEFGALVPEPLAVGQPGQARTASGILKSIERVA